MPSWERISAGTTAKPAHARRMVRRRSTINLHVGWESGRRDRGGNGSENGQKQSDLPPSAACSGKLQKGFELLVGQRISKQTAMDPMTGAIRLDPDDPGRQPLEFAARAGRPFDREFRSGLKSPGQENADTLDRDV